MRPIRFGVATEFSDNAADFAALASQVEALGYDIFLIPDHTFTLSPEVGLMAAAAVTERLRIGTLVYNNDLRHPVITAQQAATLDRLSNGRFELGIGAGWNKPEYDAMGISYDRASVRIARLEESVTIIKALLDGETVSFAGEHYTINEHRIQPEPLQGADMPIHIGGNGDKLLAVAARHASIVGISPYGPIDGQMFPTHFASHQVAERIDHIRLAAGDRLDDIEINVPVQHVAITDDREHEIARLAHRMRERFGNGAPGESDLAGSPFVLVGSIDDIARRVIEFNRTLGISFLNMWSPVAEAFAPVIEAVRGRPAAT